MTFIVSDFGDYGLSSYFDVRTKRWTKLNAVPYIKVDCPLHENTKRTANVLHISKNILLFVRADGSILSLNIKLLEKYSPELEESLNIKYEKGDCADYIAFEYPLVAIATVKNKLLIHNITNNSLQTIASFKGRCLGLRFDPDLRYLYMSKSSPSSVAVYESVDEVWQAKAEVMLPEPAMSMCKSGDSLWVCGPALGIARIFEDGSKAIRKEISVNGLVSIPGDLDKVFAYGDSGIYQVNFNQNRREDVDYDLEWIKEHQNEFPKLLRAEKSKILNSVLHKLVSKEESDIWIASQILKIIKNKLLEI